MGNKEHFLRFQNFMQDLTLVNKLVSTNSGVCDSQLYEYGYESEFHRVYPVEDLAQNYTEKKK